MSDYNFTNRDKERYWASEDGLDENGQERDDEFGGATVLVEACKERFKSYCEYFERHESFNRIIRNYLYYHGHYYGRTHNYTFRDLRRLGSQGELVGANINHFRNLIQHIISIVTQHKINIETQAVNVDRESIEQARLGDSILESYIQKDRIDRFMKRALEHCLILLQGFVYTSWDYDKGQQISEPSYDESGEMTGESVFEGDVECCNPTVFDVACDPCVTEWDKHEWFIIRTWENRFNLAAKYPDFREEILAVDVHEDSHEGFFFHFDPTERAGSITDLVPVFTLVHKKTRALPDGKQFSYVGDVPLDVVNNPYPWKGITLRRMVPAESILNTLGYSPANDLQGPQEIYNAESSAICTNHKTFGVQNVWMQTGDKPKVSDLSGGLRLIQSRTKPEELSIAATKAEVFQYRNDVRTFDMENLAGISGTVRGAPEANVKSGTAMALLDAKSVQFSSRLSEMYHQTFEDFGTDILYLINANMYEGHQRTYAVKGKHGRSSQYVMEYGGMNSVDRVTVRAGSALARTQSGRLELAKLYIKAGLIRIPEELINVVESGQIDPILEAERAQLDLVRDENEKMMDQRFAEMAALQTDNHVLHIREHQAILNSVEFRMDVQQAQQVMAHIMEHVQYLMDPGIQMLQAILGFGGMPGMGMGMGMGQPSENPDEPDGPQLEGAKQPKPATPPEVRESA